MVEVNKKKKEKIQKDIENPQAREDRLKKVSLAGSCYLFSKKLHKMLQLLAPS